MRRKISVLSIDEDILRIRANREPDEELHTGSIYYKHRPRQIDKRIMLPISPPDSEKIVAERQPMSTVSLQ